MARLITILSRPALSAAPRLPMIIVMAAAAWLFALTVAYAAPSADLWDRWTAHDASSKAVVNHGAWDGFLKRYVSEHDDGVTRVAYGKVTAGDRQALAAYVDALAVTPISRFNRAEQFAYWVNLYNALTVKVILDHYPVASIRDIDISPGLFSDGPWGRDLVTIEGEKVSLDDIEHRILRPIWRDPRIHYAVNCASIGCPNLETKAITAANAESYLDAAARAYINDPRGAQIVGGRLVVSSIYDWFESDFGGNDAGVIAHLRQYAAPALATELAKMTSVADDRYDWTLNDSSPRPVPQPVRQWQGNGS